MKLTTVPRPNTMARRKMCFIGTDANRVRCELTGHDGQYIYRILDNVLTAKVYEPINRNKIRNNVSGYTRRKISPCTECRTFDHLTDLQKPNPQ